MTTDRGYRCHLCREHAANRKLWVAHMVKAHPNDWLTKRAVKELERHERSLNSGNVN